MGDKRSNTHKHELASFSLKYRPHCVPFDHAWLYFLLSCPDYFRLCHSWFLIALLLILAIIYSVKESRHSGSLHRMTQASKKWGICAISGYGRLKTTKQMSLNHSDILAAQCLSCWWCAKNNRREKKTLNLTSFKDWMEFLQMAPSETTWIIPKGKWSTSVILSLPQLYANWSQWMSDNRVLTKLHHRCEWTTPRIRSSWTGLPRLRPITSQKMHIKALKPVQTCWWYMIRNESLNLSELSSFSSCHRYVPNFLTWKTNSLWFSFQFILILLVTAQCMGAWSKLESLPNNPA